MTVKNYKVLVGDDDPSMLRLLSRWLQNAGYPTQTVADGQEALDAIERECPDFVITDWEMPRLNGFELCRLVREMSLPHYVYILFLTAKTASDEMIAGLEVGADDFIRKPVLEGELLARLRAGSRVLELERRLRVMARTDSLTGLLTQRSLYEALAREWHRSRRFHFPLSCVMMDLDFFKQINDVHGHPAGDLVLKSVADLLTDTCRASDFVCRYGGEEFCVLLPETNEMAAAAWAERSRQRLSKLRIAIGSVELRITGSFGVAECHDDMCNSEELVEMADQALLCAKRTGRDCIIRFASMIDAAEPKLQSLAHQEETFEGVLARDVMSPLAVCPRSDATIDEAAQFFLESGAASSPILDVNGGLVGFLSEKDLMAVMTSPDCWRRPVHTVMRSNVICYEEDTPIRTIYDFFCRVPIHRVVITKNGRPTGTISHNCLLRWFRDRVISKGLVSPSSRSDSSCGCNIAGTASALGPHTPGTEPAIPSAE